jgi:hypothetical protein
LPKGRRKNRKEKFEAFFLPFLVNQLQLPERIGQTSKLKKLFSTPWVFLGTMFKGFDRENL